jgi:hypothetical protein
VGGPVGGGCRHSYGLGLYVYSCVGKPDAKTARLQAKVGGWACQLSVGWHSSDLAKSLKAAAYCQYSTGHMAVLFPGACLCKAYVASASRATCGE